MLDCRRTLRVLLVCAATVSTACIEVHSAVGATPDELAQAVVIRRTDYGVPHIQADTLEAVAFGFAYCQAEDHLLNIMKSMIAARGELALHFGGDENIEADFRNRQFEVRERAIATYHLLDPEYRQMVEGFTAGLNFYVQKHRDELPDWVPVLTGHDVHAHGINGISRFAFGRSKLIENFLKSKGVTVASTNTSDDDETYGSNMWAFAPSRTKSGHTILMGNPHQPWSPVATYYEAHMIVPGKLNFYGSTFVGRPILTSGWNDQLGWSHTVNGPDLEEIYELTLDPEKPDHYVFDGASIPLREASVTIQVKTDSGVESQSRTFWHTALGPVIHRSADKVYILRSASYGEYRSYEQWLRMSQARTFDEFRQTLEMQAIPMFNIAYADRVGNIFFIWNGTVPTLPHPAHETKAVPASKSDQIWTRFHALDELPQLFNPPGGYVQNCNSPPYITTLHQPLDPGKFPPHFSKNDLSLRTQHSLELIHNDRRLSLEDVWELKHSPRMLLADRVKDDLIAAVHATHLSGEVLAAADFLKSWDNTVSINSRGSALFALWWDRYSKDDAGGFAVPWDAAAPMATPRGLNRPDWAVESFVAAIEDAKTRYGDWKATWGDTHRIRFENVDLPVSGGDGKMGCFRVALFRTDKDGKEVMNSGDGWVFAVEFGDQPRAYSVLGYSQSEVPGSRYYADQAKMFSEHRMKPVAFTAAQIGEQLVEQYRPCDR